MGTCSSQRRPHNKSKLDPIQIRKRISVQSEGSYHRLVTPRKRKELDISRHNVGEVYNISSTVLGEGHYGSVYKASSKKAGDTCFAIKIVDRKDVEKNIQQIIRELNIMRDTDHPNIVKFCETYSSRTRFYIIMEYLEGGTLKDYVKMKGVLSEEEAKGIIFQICLALNHIHDKGIAHRDFKLDNFIFKDKERKHIKLIDFGLAKNFKKERLTSHIGTPYYAPPEILKFDQYNEKCDLWSLGVCLYKMLTGNYPFKADNLTNLFEKIKNDSFDEKVLSSFSKECRSFLKSLLVKKPKNRKNIKDIIFHPWFNEHHQKLIQNNKKSITETIFKNLKGINRVNTFGLQLLKIMITFFSKPKDFETSLKVFFCADYCLNGLISSDDLQRFFNDNKENINEEELNSVMEALNIFEKDFITFSEFMVATIDRYDWIVNGDLIASLFDFLDVDNTKRVTVANLKELFTRFGYMVDANYVREMIEFFGEDVQINGLDLDTFSRYVLNNFFNKEKDENQFKTNA